MRNSESIIYFLMYFTGTSIDPYFDLQVLGLKTVLSNAHNKNTEKLLQDYLTFIPNLGDFGSLNVSVLKARFKDNIQPLITIAGKNGFEFL